MNKRSILFTGSIIIVHLYSISIANAVEPVPGTGNKQAAQIQSQMQLTDRLIVKLRAPKAQTAAMAPLRSTQIQKMTAIAGITLNYLRPMSGQAHVLKLPYKMTLTQARFFAAALNKNVSIAYAVPDIRVQAMKIPNDPLYVKQWHYKAAIKHGMNLPGAWNITTGSATTVTAVIDTGILPHADLDPARIVPGYDFIADLATANDGNGRDPNPTDPGDGVPFVRNSSWHGTHVAGTIGAWTNNGMGVAGIDWAGKILPVRVLGVGGGWTSDVVDAIVWAAGGMVPGVPANANPAHVINLSLGGAGACGPVWQNAIDTAVAKGTTVVVSAGNSSADAAAFTPASCNNVITVAAHNNMSAISYYSNFGAAVKIMAPGGEQFFTNDPGGVLSTLDSGIITALGDNSYRFYQGTSMAAPHIAGLAALMHAVNPSLTPAQISTAIQNSARPFIPGGLCLLNPGRCGAGIADAKAAVLAVTPPSAPSQQIATAVSDTQIDITWTDNASNETGFKIERKTGAIGIYQQIATTAANITSFKDTTGSEGLTYYYRVRAYHAYASSPYSNRAFATTLPAAPTALSASAVSATQIQLSWTDNSAIEAGFKIERSKDGVNYTPFTKTAANVTSYTHSGLSPSTTYYYRVRAFDANGNSSYSNANSATTGGIGGGSFGSILFPLALLWMIRFSIRRKGAA